MVLCMIFAHDFGRDGFRSMVLDTMGFRSMVLDSLTCINMYCNIGTNNEKSSWKSWFWDPMENLHVYVFYGLCSCIVYFLFFRIHM